jgi:predicted GH43/DUF377 family glycosyl hydrolase
MSNWKVLVLFSFMLAAAGSPGCSEKKGTNPQKEDPVEHSFVFTKSPENQPVVSSGKTGWPIFPSDPAVIKDSEGYHLFYTSIFCNAGGSYYYSWDASTMAACDITNVIATVGYAFSSDSGKTWEFRGSPVYLPGSEPWHQGDIETPHVAILGDSLYLFYSATGVYQGQPFPHRYQVGVATLDLNGKTIRQKLMTDLATFTGRSEPLLPYNVSVTSYDNNTQEPSVVIKDGKLELYYVGVGFTLPDQNADAPGQSVVSVGLAKAVFQQDLQLVEKSNGYILPNANITEVKYFDDAYHVFSTTLESGEFHHNEKINYFRSVDGVKWSEPKILLRPGATFDSWGVMAPTVVVEDSELVLFYTGWCIENHQCFPEPLPPDIRFGRPSNNDTECIYGSVGRAVAPRPGTDRPPQR